MNPALENEVQKIYAKYRTVLKPLIAEIESLDQEFPLGVLNEIRACFDHLARCHTDTNSTAKNVAQAKGHIDRAVLDAYKVLIVIFHDKTETFRIQHKNKDWSTVDGGRFNSSFHKIVGDARQRYIEAKQQPDLDEKWLTACLAYRNVYLFLENPQNVLLVNEGTNKETWKGKLLWSGISAAIGVFLGYVIAALS